jgi:hypothetical protein
MHLQQGIPVLLGKILQHHSSCLVHPRQSQRSATPRPLDCSVCRKEGIYIVQQHQLAASLHPGSSILHIVGPVWSCGRTAWGGGGHCVH